MKIGFIGLGNMGLPMALNLLKNRKFDVMGYDINPYSLRKFKKNRGKISKSLKEIINFSDVIITCLPGPKQIQKVAFGKNKIIKNIGIKKIWIDCSTNSLKCCALIKKRLGKNSKYFLDAPMSGGSTRAKSGELSIYVGGDKKIFSKVKIIFNTIGKLIYYLGSSGAGYATKIAQVSLCYLSYLSLSEALMLGVKSGANPKTMLEIINNSASGSFTSKKYGPNMVNGNYDRSFALGLSYKDLTLANDIIRKEKIRLPITELTTKIYRKALEKYGPKANHLKAIRLMEENNKLFFQTIKKREGNK